MPSSNAVILNHPLAEHHLAVLRDRKTPPEQFRRAVQRLSTLLCVEAARDLPLRREQVRTPIALAPAARIRDRIGLVPILRAGLGMVDPILELLPEAEVWHLGMYRDEQTRNPVEYYKKFPARNPVRIALVLDPMLATGGSSCSALNAVLAWGVREVRLLSILAAPEGLRRVRAEFPKVPIYVAGVDRRLNRKAFIVPGLGDAGDRQFNAVS
ncbi:MAG: uracil phosphoribosyltransferase [Kiritimatiellae bacterium]|nr:uracil phosphoribosyltransferase [Kiritimatiellia bacterium]